MNTRSQGRQNQQNRPYKPYINRGREIIPIVAEVMIDPEIISEIGLINETGVSLDLVNL